MTKMMEFVNEFIENSKGKIVELAKTNLLNDEKKASLDAYIIEFAEKALSTMKLNWIGKLVIKKWVLPNIPQLTQYIYDLLKAKLEELA